MAGSRWIRHLTDRVADAWVVEEKRISFRPSDFSDVTFVFERDLKEARARRRTGYVDGPTNDRDWRIE